MRKHDVTHALHEVSCQKKRSRTFEPTYRSLQPLQAKCSTALTALAVHQGDKQTRRLSLVNLLFLLTVSRPFSIQRSTVLFSRTIARYWTKLLSLSFSRLSAGDMTWSHSRYSLSVILTLRIFVAQARSLFPFSNLKTGAATTTYSSPLHHSGRLVPCHLAFRIFWYFTNSLSMLNDAS